LYQEGRTEEDRWKKEGRGEKKRDEM
jgi:hypothetical protein